jgi:hypothetical protein
VIPYRGYLEEGGTPINGTKSLGFAIYPDTSANTDLWDDVFSSVTLTGGRFTVSLGSQKPLPAGLFDRGALYLAITVNGVALNGRQQFLPVPFSQRASGANHSAGDFAVNGALSVSGPATIGSITGLLPITKDAAGNQTLQFSYAGDQFGGGGLAYRPVGAPGSLAVNGAGVVPNRDIQLYDNVGVAGRLSVRGGMFSPINLSAGTAATTAPLVIENPSPTDEIVVVQLNATNDGARGRAYIYQTIGATVNQLASTSVHQTSSGQTYVAQSTMTVPIPKGTIWQINFYSDVGTVVCWYYIMRIAP